MDSRHSIVISILFCILMVTASSTATLMVANEFTTSDIVTPDPIGEQWEMTFGGPANDRGQTILPATGGGFAIAGYTASYGAGIDDTWFVLMDEYGTVLSNQTFGTATYERAYDMCLTSDGGYALAGYQGLSRRDFYVVRLNAAGGLLWDNPYGTGAGEEVWSIIEDSDGYLVMAGFTTFQSDARVTKINSTNGLEEWSYNYGGPGLQWGRGIVEVPGGYVIAGISDDWSEGAEDMWLFMIDHAGTLQWNKTYGYFGTDYAFDLALDPSGNLVLAGCTQTLSSDYDFWMVITDPMGNHISNHTFGGVDTEMCQRIAAAADGTGFLLAGYTRSFGEGGEDMYMVRTDNAGTLIWDMTNGTIAEDRAEGVAALSDGGFIMTGYTDTAGAGWELRGVRLWYDTDPPNFTNLPADIYIYRGETVDYQVHVYEHSGMRNFWLNDSRLSISFYGYITNTSTLEVGTYTITVNAMDKYYNPASEVLTIHVEDPASTTTTTTTTATTTAITTTTTTTSSNTTTTTSTDTTGEGLGLLMLGLGTGCVVLVSVGLFKLYGGGRKSGK